MPEHRKYCTEDFVLTQVMNRRPAFIYLAALIGFFIGGLIYVFVIQGLFYRGGLPLAFGIMILVMMLLLKTQAKTVVVYLDEKSIFINNRRFLRQEIEYIETYSYDKGERSQIYFRIKIINGDNLYITDTRLFERKDQQQIRLLKKLVNALIKRLNLMEKDKRGNHITYIILKK